MTSFNQKVIFYIDDLEINIEAFRTTCEVAWQSEFTVQSNNTFERIDKSNFDSFAKETLAEMNRFHDELECVLLDLNYSGEETPATSPPTKNNNMRVGLELGRLIRKNFPLLPIFIASRFEDEYIKLKGLSLDFDHIDKPENYSNMKENTFKGILTQAKDKRMEIVKNLPDIPTAYLTNDHRYFKKTENIDNFKNKVFIAMPFNTNIVTNEIKIMIFEAVEENDLVPYKVDEHIFDESIIEKIGSNIFESNHLIADITNMNPNVMFELGMAMASNKKCIVIMNKDKNTEIPFDLRSIPIITYSANEPYALKDNLRKRLKKYQPAK